MSVYLQKLFMYKRPSAYTLIEVLIVVLIIGVASAIVVPQMLSAGTLGVQAAARMIMADILYAQNEAIAQQSNRKVVFDVPNNRYRLTDATGQTLTVNWKGSTAQNYVVDFNNDDRFNRVQIVSAAFSSGNTLEFNDMGGPLNGGTVELRFNNDRYRITVAPFTGRVTVDKI